MSTTDICYRFREVIAKHWNMIGLMWSACHACRGQYAVTCDMCASKVTERAEVSSSSELFNVISTSTFAGK